MAALGLLATALVGAAGGALEAAGRSRHRWQGVAAPVYCGAFAGMTSELVLGHPAWVVLAGGLAGLVLSVLIDSWSGIGGKLGTTALLGVVGVMGLALVSGAIGAGAPLHAFTGVERWLVLIASLLSPLLTHRLSYYWGFGVVLGSALLSMLVALLLALLLAMGLLFALQSFSFAPRLAGIGGDLGATAAVWVFAVLGARVLVRDRR
jgi:hypothetical protein